MYRFIERTTLAYNYSDDCREFYFIIRNGIAKRIKIEIDYTKTVR